MEHSRQTSIETPLKTAHGEPHQPKTTPPSSTRLFEAIHL